MRTDYSPVDPEVRPDDADAGVGLTRRTFLDSAAAAAVVIGVDDYVRPALRILGITRQDAFVSIPPPPPPPLDLFHGCTPGFWANSGNPTAGGREWWDEASDPQWTSHGGAGTNPYSQSTLFNSFFTPHPNLAAMTMYEVANSGGQSDRAKKAGRQLVAAYLNAAFGGTFAYTTGQLSTMWTAAVDADLVGHDSGAALLALANQLDSANERCDARS